MSPQTPENNAAHDGAVSPLKSCITGALAFVVTLVALGMLYCRVADDITHDHERRCGELLREARTHGETLMVRTNGKC